MRLYFYRFFVAMMSVFYCMPSFSGSNGDWKYISELIRYGSYKEFAGYIEEKPYLIKEVYEGRTVLAVAAYWGRKSMVNFLLSAGADPNDTVDFDKTPLSYALSGLGGPHVYYSSNGEVVLERVFDYLNVILSLLQNGAEYKGVYKFGPSGMVVYVYDLIIESVCDSDIYRSDFEGKISEISRVMNVEGRAIKNSFYLMHLKRVGQISEGCFSLFWFH
ncbi:ankyrin repeat domain-containing protein [Pseudothauera nasutitermitis]|uniref:Ankyrin repeat domain-containing protein n=1 Tax=Pseudothauera nasutitermitis TaxID=2565930 RepID=A0A4S4AZI6_9RHOO|nr:ankyrin repeat domain-containing protein [Pseudothauera nasutitermitis]THF65561.1 ankyrin repeat domain-containing protein [Pseudothauera nasutitermitis]